MELTRKNQIIKVAATLFRERGYNAVSMRDIAKVMEMKASSLYNHISGKQEILSSLIIEVAQAFTSEMSKIIATHSTALKQIEKVVEIHIDVTVTYSENIASLNNDWMHLEGKLDHYLSLRTCYEKKFREIVLKGKESGELKNVNTEVLIYSILTTLRNLYLWIPKKGELQKDRLIDDLSIVLLQGIEK